MQHDKESINIGFDASNDNSQYNFFDVGYGWENSSMQGSLMIRPVLGGDYDVQAEDPQNLRLRLFPNPSKDVINIGDLDVETCREIMIFDMTGRLMKHFTHELSLDVNDLPTGLYMMRVVSDSKVYTEKFMISR